jgi:hypothetical protein
VPVFHKVQDDVLVFTVDGDFTPGELARKGANALEDDALPSRVAVLLDVSGAAGATASEVVAMAGVFVEHPTDIPRIAVLGSVEPIEAEGVEVKGFYRRAEALEWLQN